VFGEIQITAELRGGDPVSEVAFYVDGSRVKKFTQPPYSMTFDVGQANLEHHIRAVATTLFGKRIEGSVTTPAIEVGSQLDVELVQLFMKVKADDGRRVDQLTAGDFEIDDSAGGREPAVTFSTEEPPLSAVVLVDASDSMKGEPLRRAVEGAKSVTQLLRPEDEVMISLFSDRLLRSTEFTRSAQTLDSALEGVEAAGGTAVYDHLYYALNRLELRLGRPVVILLSDGEDVSSVLDATEVRWRVRRSQVTLYWARLREPGKPAGSYISAWRDFADNDKQTAELEAAVDESGGRIVDIDSLERLEGALKSIFAELRSQVVLGFQPNKRRHDGSWRTIDVRGVHGRLDVKTRAGYVDD
jgi:VWFA-related protein